MTAHEKAARDYTLDTMERIVAELVKKPRRSGWENERMKAFKNEMKRRRKAMA